MAISLLDQLSQAISPAISRTLSNHLGESEPSVQNGIAALLPVLLSGLASKAATPAGASSVFSQLNDARVDTGLLDNLPGLLASGRGSALGELGSSLLAGLFSGSSSSSVGNVLSKITGMRAGSGSSLVAMVVPLVFGYLKRFIGERGLNAGGLASLLMGQRGQLSGKLEPSLTAAFGLGSPGQLLGSLGGATAAAAAPAAAATAAAGAGLGRLLPWLIGALVLLAALWYFLGHRKPAAPVVTGTPAVAVADLHTPAKVYFETGSATLGAESAGMVRSVAGLMNSDRSMKVAITGYTDRTGDAAVNEELAKNRALAVRDALVAAGVDAGRIETRPPMFVEVGAGGADAQARRVEISAN